jgi:hypothetical protein
MCPRHPISEIDGGGHVAGADMVPQRFPQRKTKEQT